MWMAHHQGMSLLAFTNLLFGNPLRQYSHREPQVLATERFASPARRWRTSFWLYGAPWGILECAGMARAPAVQAKEDFHGGRDRTRTCDLLRVKQAL